MPIFGLILVVEAAEIARTESLQLGESTVSENGQRADQPIEEYEYSENPEALVRRVGTRDGGAIESLIDAKDIREPRVEDDLRALYDRAWLRSDVWQGPPWTGDNGYRGTVRLVDLFSGCGGMTLGVWEACRALGYRLEPILAVDVDSEARSVFQSNFSEADVEEGPVEELFNGGLGDALTESEQEIRDRLGRVDLLVAGPPCQGSSDLNNHTRREDPKNALYAKVGRAAEVLEPDHIIVENVLGIRHDENRVFQRTKHFLEHELQLECGNYSVDSDIVQAEKLGVPQTRHRVFLVASTKHQVNLQNCVKRYLQPERDFWWACEDLVDKQLTETGFNSTTSSAPVTEKRIDHLFDEGLHDLPDELRPPCHRDKDHSYPSVYGRMWKNQPAPTITTGFTSMGQGRFVHPTRRRTITPHEAARLQFFPDFYDFGDRSRADYKTLIGNAVPPKLTQVIGLDLFR